MTDITPQAEEYLEAICRIQDRRELASPTELARELDVAPPSVLGMLKRLDEQGLVRYTRQTGALLTEHGQQCAETLRRRHRLAERLLTDLLSVPWARAHDLACRLEHIIDDELEGYLNEALHHPTTCPHGNPLATTLLHATRPLSSLAPGESGRLSRILDESGAGLTYLAELALLPGAEVTMCAEAPYAGPFTVDVAGQRHALSRAMAAHLLVEVSAGGTS
jgi:DtxR family Mn-dependent transcriptional regulator